LKGIPIGQILIQQGVLTNAQVEEILSLQKESHRPFGDLAERLFGVNPRAVEDAWVEQYTHTVGMVDLEDQRIDEQCLRLLNRRQAWQFHTLPMNRETQNLNAATSPQDLVRAVNFSSRKIDEPIAFLLAEREQLREFLMRHYPVPTHIADFAATM
jgi:MSHA biogenesis protein MshE